MARLFKPSTTRYVDANGKRCNKGDPGARKEKPTKSGKWRGEYRDANGALKSVSLCSNKSAARRMLKEIEDRVDLEKAGLSESFEESAKTPLSQHVDEFECLIKQPVTTGRLSSSFPSGWSKMDERRATGWLIWNWTKVRR